MKGSDIGYEDVLTGSKETLVAHNVLEEFGKWKEELKKELELELSGAQDLAKAADIAAKSLEKHFSKKEGNNNSLHKVPADNRHPRSLYAHMRFTAGIAVSWWKSLEASGKDDKEEALFDNGRYGYRSGEYTPEEIRQMLRLAGLFHDTGKIRGFFVLGALKDHEKESVNVFSEIFSASLPRRYLEPIKRLIETHHSSQYHEKNPEHLLERLVADADTIESAMDRGERRSDLSRKERALAILYADADSIHGYVSNVINPRFLRGGSELISAATERLARIIGDRACPECVIYAGGGNITAILPSDEGFLASLEKEMKEAYANETGGASITIAHIIAQEDDIAESTGKFGVLWKELHKKIDAAKHDVVLDETAIDETELCEACAEEKYAGERQLAGADRSTLLCEKCLAKLQRGIEIKQQKGATFEDYKDKKGYIALIEADANRAGSWFSKSKTPAEFYEKSIRFDSFVRAMVGQLKEGIPADKLEGVYVGGDEFKILVPGDTAPDAVARAFGFIKREMSNSEITFGLGFTVAKYDYPFREINKKTKEVLERAKREKQTSQVAFEMLKRGIGRGLPALSQDDYLGLVQGINSVLGDIKDNHSAYTGALAHYHHEGSDAFGMFMEYQLHRTRGKSSAKVFEFLKGNIKDLDITDAIIDIRGL